MTENEAIEWLKKIYIDTNQSDKCISLKTAISALIEIQQYRSIGTVEECQNAVDRQTKKRPVEVDNCGNVCSCERCPNCFEIVSGDYCEECGQAIGWS